MALDTKAIVRIAGAVIGGAVTAAIAVKKMPTPHVGQKVLAGMATVGGATVGYYVSGWIADRIIRDDIDKIPAQQATSLPGQSTPTETPTAEAAMGAVAERAAVTAKVSKEEVGRGPVVDIPKDNVVPIGGKAVMGMDTTAFGSDPQ
jgi:hypothetical protein